MRSLCVEVFRHRIVDVCMMACMLCGAFLQCCIKSLLQDAAGRVASAAMRVESFQLFTKYFQVCACVCVCVCVTSHRPVLDPPLCLRSSLRANHTILSGALVSGKRRADEARLP
jgi:hypothetical protein